MLRQFFCYEGRWKLKAEKYCCIFIATSWWCSVLFHLSDRSIRSKPSKERQRVREGTERNKQLHSFFCCIFSLPVPTLFFFPDREAMNSNRDRKQYGSSCDIFCLLYSTTWTSTIPSNLVLQEYLHLFFINRKWVLARICRCWAHISTSGKRQLWPERWEAPMDVTQKWVHDPCPWTLTTDFV